MSPQNVYFIRPVGMPGPIKIGCSNVPPIRLRELAGWSPFPLEIVAVIPGTIKLERNIHECFADAHSHHEWFHPTTSLVEAVAKIAAGVPVGEAIDLTKRRGWIQNRGGNKNWTEDRRRWQSYAMRLRHAVKTAEKITGERRETPDDVHIQYGYYEGWNTPELIARYDAIIADPVSNTTKFTRSFEAAA